MNERTSIVIKSIPVGLVNDILNIVNLAGEIITVLYQNDSTDFYESYISDIPKGCEKVNMIIDYAIESSIKTSFATYIETTVDNMVENYCSLNKSWRLEYDECK